MLKRSFFCLAKPKLNYPFRSRQDVLTEISLPNEATLYKKHFPDEKDAIVLKPGDPVKTGEKLILTENEHACLISTVTGTIKEISEYTGYLGQIYTTITVETDKEDQIDEAFGGIVRESGLEDTIRFLSHLPGDTDFTSLLQIKSPCQYMIINGLDQDLLISNNQFTVNDQIETLSKGIESLKALAPECRMIIAVPPDLADQGKKSGAEVKIVNPVYPNTLPNLIIKEVLGKAVPAGKRYEELGIGVIGAEAVVSMAKALDEKKVPVDKLLTIIKKDHTQVSIKARIGTPVKEILNALQIETDSGDRIIFGGPMTGNTVYSEDVPILFDTHAVIVQDKHEVIPSSDSQCINCGECVRICPAKIPVNMLVRLLENGLYEDAVYEYDLLSCIECGLCSYSCVARIPVFHYIMLGKSEFARIENAEESNA